jgi:hypothetical protein
LRHENDLLIFERALAVLDVITGLLSALLDLDRVRKVI